MQDWRFGPPVLVGERVEWVKGLEGQTESGVVRWIGKLSKESADWTVGLELDRSLQFGGTDGSWGDRKLFHCEPAKGVFLPLSRIRKEHNRRPGKADNSGGNVRNRDGIGQQCDEDGEKSGRREEAEPNMSSRTSYNDLPKRIDNLKGDLSEDKEVFNDTDNSKCDVREIRKSVKRRKRRNKSPRAGEDSFGRGSRRSEPRRPFSLTGIRNHEDDARGKEKTSRKHESCALEEEYIREFIQREIRKQQNYPIEENMNGVKGNFKRIDEDDITAFDENSTDVFRQKGDGVSGRQSRGMAAFHRRDKSNGFFSFLKWFKKSKEMPELEGAKDSSVTSSPLFARRRSSSCGSVDTLFSIATANSFAFVTPMQYQAVISASHTSYSVSDDKVDDESKSRCQSDYENSPSPAIKEVKTGEDTGRKKKCRAPGPPAAARDISLPSTLEHRRANEDDLERACHRRTSSESFKDRKAGFYCHVQGKRKAPLPPSAAPLYPSLTSLKSQYPSINKKKRPAPQPPDAKDIPVKNKEQEAGRSDAKAVIPPCYDNIPYLQQRAGELNCEESPKENVVLKSKGNNVSPLLGLGTDNSPSPLPSRPWYKRNPAASNISKKDSVKLSDRRKNKENEEWMPEVGFSRRPISSEYGHNLFNLLTRLDKGQDKKKEEKRKSQISILANISELDREAAEIVRREHAQEKKLLADRDERYYSTHYDSNVLPPTTKTAEDVVVRKFLDNGDKMKHSPNKVITNPFDEFKPKTDGWKEDTGSVFASGSERPQKGIAERADNVEYDANAELDYYINPWNCPKCTLENPGWEKFCEACNTMRVKFQENKGKAQVDPVPAAGASEENNSKHLLKKSKSEEAPATANEDDMDDPSEDNVEGVRRKRLAFFQCRQSSDPATADNAEKLKLKIILKEMKNSLPKREKGVINNANDVKEDALEIKSRPEATILCCSKEADAKPPVEELSNAKVQQTRQLIVNEADKYGAIKKVKQKEVTPNTVAEAIVVTKTTVFEDIIVKKADKPQKVSSSAQTNRSVKDERGKGGLLLNAEREDRTASESTASHNHGCANVQNVKETPLVLDLTTGGSSIADGDIEAITARLQEEGAGSVGYQVDIRATGSATAANQTVDVNRLLRKLEAAINTGQHYEAANIAKDLAKMKISCSVKRHAFPSSADQSKLVVDLYVEDKSTQKGPIKIQIFPSITLGQLKAKVEKQWSIPCNIQRWILGKQLATDDSKTLEEHGVVNSGPLFLYVVTPEQHTTEKGSEATKREPAKIDKRNGRVSDAHVEERRPSLILEEEGENTCDASEAENRIFRNEDNPVKPAPAVAQPSNDEPSTSVPPASCAKVSQAKESVQRRNSQTSYVFEKREIAENLKKELKLISANSIKDRIERLNRAASGRAPDANETDQGARKIKNAGPQDVSNQKWHYNELMELENADLVTNLEPFECPICLVEYPPGDGVVLKDCLHTFCRTCLIHTVQFNEEAEVKCPYRDNNYSCDSVLQQREIKSLVPKGLFEQHLAKSVSVAENNIGNAYHCKTPDCKGWCILEDNVNEFRCPVCKKVNCLTCQSIHTGLNCRQYQEQIQFASDTNVDAKKTRDMLQEMVEKGEAMACPTCQVVLMKKWGCDWLRCSMCKTEICWVTRGPRWGPEGKGDISGGCQCGINGIKCHPKCNYCH